MEEKKEKKKKNTHTHTHTRIFVRFEERQRPTLSDPTHQEQGIEPKDIALGSRSKIGKKKFKRKEIELG